jgi:hypothetical protein
MKNVSDIRNIESTASDISRPARMGLNPITCRTEGPYQMGSYEPAGPGYKHMSGRFHVSTFILNIRCAKQGEASLWDGRPRPSFCRCQPSKIVNVETEFGREVLPQKIRTVLPDNFLKICEIGGICGFNFGI